MPRAQSCTLNPVGTMVWNELDGERTVGQLAVDLRDQFTDVGMAELESDIAAFLRELLGLGLVVDAAS
ncbi:MAG: PqqD family protein [Ilumatobacteraceae bacterium]